MSSDIQFCKECRNVLRPEEDRAAKMLMLVCQTCTQVTYTNNNDQNQNCIEQQNFDFRSAEDVRTHIYAGVEEDPTLPRAHDYRCPKCSSTEAVYFQLPERVADDALTLVFVCSRCTHYQIKGKVAADEDDDQRN